MRANYKVELASGIFLLLGVAALIWLATKATNYGQEIGEDAYLVSARFSNVAADGTAPVRVRSSRNSRQIEVRPAPREHVDRIAI